MLAPEDSDDTRPSVRERVTSVCQAVLWRNERRDASHYEYGYLFANLFGQRAEDICENRVRTTMRAFSEASSQLLSLYALQACSGP